MLSLLLLVVVAAAPSLAESPDAGPPATDAAAADAPAEPPPPDPAASPITIPMSPDSPGPFGCTVDPYVVVRQGETTRLSVRLRVDEPGNRLYRDRVEVELAEGSVFTAGTLHLPPGVEHTDAWGGPPREVYTEDTEFELELVAPADAQGRVDTALTVYWQGCSDAMCFMPASQQFSVPVRVKAAR